MAENADGSALKKRRGQVRMIDIARRAGVSRAAVSHVLNGNRSGTMGVSEKTAERIRRVAEEVRYHPNHAAQQLAGKRSGLLAVLATNWLTFPLRPQLHAHLSRAADQRGFKVLTWQSGNDVARVEQYIPELLSRKIDALIYMAFENDQEWPRVGPLLAELPSVVSLLGDPKAPGGSVVLSDPAEGARQAVDYLHSQGRRKIVQALNCRDTVINRGRRHGFIEAHRQLDLPIDPDCACLVSDGIWEDAASRGPIDICDALIAADADAVVADDDFCAALLIRALAARGCRVPDDVAVVGWGNETVSRFVMPALTTVDYRMQEIVEAALDAITASQGDGDTSGPRQVVIQPQLIVRESA